jgi:hypothetical protein
MMERKYQGRSFDPAELIAQIGAGNMMAISGLRYSTSGSDGKPYVFVVHLPVGHGYRVDVSLAADDTYTVQRVFRRGEKEWVKGQRTGVYFDEVSEAAYYASCYVSYDEQEWTVKR